MMWLNGFLMKIFLENKNDLEEKVNDLEDEELRQDYLKLIRSEKVGVIMALWRKLEVYYHSGYYILYNHFFQPWEPKIKTVEDTLNPVTKWSEKPKKTLDRLCHDLAQNTKMMFGKGDVWALEKVFKHEIEEFYKTKNHEEWEGESGWDIK